MQQFRTRLIYLVLVLVLLLPPVGTQASTDSDSLEQRVASIRASLNSVERVGQLMLVTFEGTSLDPDSPVVQLITDYNIGGVVLLAANDNISGEINTPRLVQLLTAELQQTSYNAAVATSSRASPRPFVPLFIATEHPGNGQPGTQIAQGTTPLPSHMALGATWNPDYAEQVGRIAGAELKAMGVNMLLGPPLDVLQRPQAERSLDLGVNTFGGNPFWVGEIAQVYIKGVHEGSEGHVAVIAQNFPGLGFADTQPEQEIPVVPRTVEEMVTKDLVPFYAVTGQAPSAAVRADGIQCANIRYQVANTRTNTRPVCVDKQAADQLLTLDYFRDWRDSGIVISSPLGTQAIRRYYGTIPFPHRQVAREAFLAGNDMLYLADFGPNPGDEQLANVVDVINFFAERYENDPPFRTQVDRSLDRIIRLKLTLYGDDMPLDTVLTSIDGEVGITELSRELLYEIAEESVTLIAPRRENLPLPPDRDDSIVIFTDERMVQQCSYCAANPIVDVNQLEMAIEDLYGPDSGDQIRPDQVTSFSFEQLQFYFGDVTGLPSGDNLFKTNQRIGEVLREVDWIVFVMLDGGPDEEAASVLRQFLEEQADLVARTQVVVMALDTPTYLSATEVSKLSAYFGLYSHTSPHIDAAARALFQEISFAGALPISLPAVGYDLTEVIQPDASQVVPLTIDALAGEPVTSVERAEVPFPIIVGQQLTLHAGPIIDHNGNPVPDNTPVIFTLTYITDDLQDIQTAVTQEGLAAISFTPNRAGRVHITAASSEAVRSDVLQIAVDVSSVEEPADGTPAEGITPQPAPGGSGVASVSETGGDGSASASPETLPDQPAAPGTASTPKSLHVVLRDLVLSLLSLALLSGIAFSVGRATTGTQQGGVRVVLGSVVAGLMGYIYFGIGGPGAADAAAMLDDLAATVTTLAAGFVGLLYTWWALYFSQRDT